MEILVLLIPLSVVLALFIGAGFWWSVKSGQFDDLEGPAHRIIADDDTSDVIPQIDDRPTSQGNLTSINPDERGRR